MTKPLIKKAVATFHRNSLFLSPKILFRNPIRDLFHFLPFFQNKRVQIIVNQLLLLAVIADGFSDDGGARLLFSFKGLHIGLLDTH